MSMQYEVPHNKKLRVIVDTDAACEADDPFAIAHALMSKKLDVIALLAEQFGGAETTRRSYEEITTVLKAMELEVPVYLGEEGRFNTVDPNVISPATQFIVEEALREEERPLFVLCLGAITNVACAIRSCPTIATKMTVVWIGGHSYSMTKLPFREFNAGNDIEAINYVVTSGVELWQIPSNVYGSMRIGLAEIERRIYPCGAIGKHLFEQMVQYNMSEYAGWTPGESWALGDNPAIGVALDPSCGTYEYREAPEFLEDTSYRFLKGRPLIRVYTSINVRYVLEDFIAKLELLYGIKI